MLNDNTQQMDDLQGVVSVVNDAIKSELKDTKKWRHSQICITDNIPVVSKTKCKIKIKT